MKNASNVLEKVVKAILDNQTICKYLAYPTKESPLTEADVTDPVGTLYKTKKIQSDIFLGEAITEKGIYIRVFFGKFRKPDGTTYRGQLGIHVIYSKDTTVTTSDFNGSYKNKPLEVCFEIIDTIDTKDLGDGVRLGLSIKTEDIDHMGYNDNHACYQIVLEKLESDLRGR